MDQRKSAIEYTNAEGPYVEIRVKSVTVDRACEERHRIEWSMKEVLLELKLMASKSVRGQTRCLAPGQGDARFRFQQHHLLT